MNHDNRRGGSFTLIELLVVVSTIALLISILLPSLRRAREQAKAVVCLTHQQNIARAFTYYANDHHERLPGVDGATTGSFWWKAIDQYLDKPIPAKLLDCTRERMPEVLFCPCGKAPFPKLHMPGGIEITHYFLNGVETEKYMSAGIRVRFGLFGGEGKIGQPKTPSRCMMLGDTVSYNKIADMSHPAVIAVFEAKGADQHFAWTRYHHRSTAGFVHRGRINVGFVDGHAEGLIGRKVGPDDEYLCNPSFWPPPMRGNPSLFYPGLTLPAAGEDPLFWGPPYDRYDAVSEADEP